MKKIVKYNFLLEMVQTKVNRRNILETNPNHLLEKSFLLIFGEKLLIPTIVFETMVRGRVVRLEVSVSKVINFFLCRVKIS